MKRPFTLALIVVPIVAALFGLVALTTYADESHAELTTTVFKVEGMTCSACEGGIRIAIKKLDGVKKVTASHEEGRVTVDYDASVVSADDIKAAIEKLGYSAEIEKDKQETGGAK